jgi:hypothetical protein
MACYIIAINLVGGYTADALGLWRVRSTPAALENAHNMISRPSWNQAVMDLLVSPIVESLVIIAIIELMRRLKFRPIVGILVATALFAALHSHTIPIWGLICIPSFFIQAVSYDYWRRTSFWAGLQTIVLIHALVNLPPVLYGLRTR